MVAAHTLDQGVQWCEATLGVTPGAGGEHPLMGTHNRLLRIATAQYPRAYLEIIAIDPAASRPAAVAGSTWTTPPCSMPLRSSRASCISSPARPTRQRASRHCAGSAGTRPAGAGRATDAEGTLRWQISVRRDGQRLFYGGLPTLIQWEDSASGGRHA